ncbi:MAG: hypothetical protein HPY69_07775 [Armatimonadetes bacterium]|nr:hypothetical protein [Armatimonadota bacterium]
MKLLVDLRGIGETDRAQVGGKAFALSRLVRAGLLVPPGMVVTAEAYRQHLTGTGLGGRIHLELERKRFKDLRWEEMWDAALRIRNMFLNTPLPPHLRQALADGIGERWAEVPVVVRSSALDEDASGSSFAGLHESYVNVRGVEAILDHVRLVWASLWSDAALLYRQELGLDVGRSAMAVLIQQLVSGERSGVVFSVHPTDGTRAMVEAVHGLNQGLVDGTVEPDRWVLDRASGRLVGHHAPQRLAAVRPSGNGVGLEALPAELAATPPLDEREVVSVYELARRCEDLFGCPQDVEWTYAAERLFVLQSRPVTTHAAEDGQRSWYLSLRRSYDNLQKLRQRIEGELIPAMVAAAEGMAAVSLADLSDPQLADELQARLETLARWKGIYWDELIPFAHGARLFGQVYNDTVRPDDPFEFISLLSSGGLASLKRNQAMAALVSQLREDRSLAAVRDGTSDELPDQFAADLDDLAKQVGIPDGVSQPGPARSALLRLLREAAREGAMSVPAPTIATPALEEGFLAHFAGAERARASDLLDLARASYRLRDDDNIYLGRIEAEVNRALEEGRRRLTARTGLSPELLEAQQVVAALRDPAYRPEPVESTAKTQTGLISRARQLIGQPAGPGLASGHCRVVHRPADLFDFRAGEILVCDALDPTMTFVVPLCAAIVERRGGMLIHGAIIAREYGLPCVTGVPQATELIHTGDWVTVDGYLGIVILASEGADHGHPDESDT